MRACSFDEEGKSQFETREKDFFFRSGGGGDWRTSGSGGGGGRARSRREGRFEDVEDGEGVVKAADASVNDLRRVGI